MRKNTSLTMSKLQQVNLRKVWNHEAHDFTRWLARDGNLNELSDAVGLEINLLEIEASVGSFNVDVLAEEENTGRKIVIENQLEATNHDHLGKIITYASGHDAEIIIWIVKDVREEHKQAVDWLNEHTDDQTYFFLIKMEVWRIGNSDLAPKFNVISQPNNWAKAIKAAARRQNLTDTKLLQLEYWKKLKEFASEKAIVGLSRKARPQHWYNISIGTSDYHIALTLNSVKSVISCQLYVPDSPEIFKELEAEKEKIESKLGYSLSWQSLEGKKASRIEITTSADYNNEARWDEQFKWLLERVEDFKNVFGRN
ncbi:MAG: DUF4268 domain-containing protein [Candidatus Pacebacteria bacterium]|nr:DUF4268 domain-containing protein [Candidatus Paceibacterota bacterium]